MNLAHYREIVLPRLLGRVVPEDATRLHHGWYGDVWSVNFLHNGVVVRASIELLPQPADENAEFTEEEAACR